MQEENKEDIGPHIERIGNVIVVHSDYPATRDVSRERLLHQVAKIANYTPSLPHQRVVDTPKPKTPKLPLDDEPLSLKQRKKLLRRKRH